MGNNDLRVFVPRHDFDDLSDGYSAAKNVADALTIIERLDVHLESDSNPGTAESSGGVGPIASDTDVPPVTGGSSRDISEEMHEVLNGGRVEQDKSRKKSVDQGRLDVGIEGDVVVRFPPEPSGYLHIGHIKALILNDYFARSNGGKLLIRFDDTNPSKESVEFEDAILKDIDILKIEYHSVSHTSDYFDLIIEKAVELINKGFAFADDTDSDEMKVERKERKESKNRDNPIGKNLEIFRGMIRGEYSNYCIRAKIDMNSNNKVMNDPVIFRHCNSEHYRTGDRYKVYPTYDFACPIVDSVEGVTHVLRTNEYRDRNVLYKWFLSHLGYPQLCIVDFSRLNFENTVLSKRKLKNFVDAGHLKWDDPRMPTLRGILRRGLSVDVFKKYILMQGVAQKYNTISWDKIYALNKQFVDPISKRYFAIPLKDGVLVKITSDSFPSGRRGCSSTGDGSTFQGREEICSENDGLSRNVTELPDIDWVTTTEMKPLHLKNHDLGLKRVFYSDEVLISQEDAGLLSVGQEITFLHWCNGIVKSINSEHGVVKEISMELNPEGDYKKTRLKIQWVSRIGSIIVRLVEYGDLIVNGSFNFNSKSSHLFVAENSVKDVTVGEVIQFERVGFFYADNNLEFNLVPFTKQLRKNKNK